MEVDHELNVDQKIDIKLQNNERSHIYWSNRSTLLTSHDKLCRGLNNRTRVGEKGEPHVFNIFMKQPLTESSHYLAGR